MSDADMEAAEIQYAPVKAGEKRRRKIEKWAIRLLILIVLAALFWKLGPVAWHRARLLYWQHLALVYTAPPEQIVYDNVPGDGKELLKTGKYHEENEADGRVSMSVEAWQRFYEEFSPPGRNSLATLFVHERRNAHGARLVVIEAVVGLYSMSDSGGELLSATVFKPGSLLAEPELALDGERHDVTHPRGARFKYFAGQVDPKNASHFTIDCEIDGKPVLIDGWLEDDDTVDLWYSAKK
jgi:hypothetical protein